jgi:type IV pilus assembly protein PilY1
MPAGKWAVGLRTAAVLFGFIIAMELGQSVPSAEAGIDLSDMPMFTRILPPPANIMFVLDDSGSMNFEILIRGEYDGSFPNPAKSASDLAIDPHGYCYVFDDVGDNVYSYSTQPDWYAGTEGRKYWKSQWYQANVMYYNPYVTYNPWPSYGTTTFLNADPDKPRSHPVNDSSYTLDLQGTSFTIGAVSVPHSHYFVFSATKAKPYLVVIDKSSSSIKYYEATVSGNGLSEKATVLTLDGNPPADVKTGRTYASEKQNFANWFTYYRRREFVAKHAIANLIKNLSEVRIGIYGINQKIVATLEPVNVTQGASISDSSNVLLGKLYPYKSAGGTPLKQGLNTVGQFYKNNTGTLAGVTGPKPYGESGQGAACQQSFTVVLTDGYYSDLTYTPTGIGNEDGDNGPPYADTAPHTLADIAMYYYENDLNALSNQVPTSKYDKATHQHMTTYAVAFGVSGTLSPDDYDSAFHHKITGQTIQWPTVPGNYRPEAIDDLWHATVNGRGKFLNANNPQELADALNELMKAIQEILIGSASSVTVNGDFLYGKLSNNTYIYQGVYSNKDDEWTGDVRAFSLDPVTGDIITDPVKWSAAKQLQTKDGDQRRIATFNGAEGKPFLTADLSPAQLSALGTDPAGKVQYLRGAEVSGYRVRSQKLGDIVNSAPVFVADGNYGVVYCGANDGMLHAFDAATGEELLAYVPNLVFGQLKLLADPAYTHRFYVDLTPTVVRGAGILGGTSQKSLLVGGLRKGGKGYFALDVTEAKTITSEAVLASRVLWEFPKSTDADLGYSFSRPVIVRSNSSAAPWVVIFGNGYNSDSGKSVLYLVRPDTGEVIKKIDADGGPDNGLSSPVAVDVTYDGKVDFVYAGDLKGNLWKFDLAADSISEWKVAFSDGTAVQPLFQARGPADSLQPITTRPDVMYHPEKHGFLVCFGTGKFLGDSDFTDNSIQSIYGVWDYGDRVYTLKTKQWSPDDDREYLGAFDRSSNKKLSNQPDKLSLLNQTQKVYTVTTGNLEQKYRVVSSLKPTWLTKDDADSGQKPNPSDAAANHAGYYCDLNTGERVISDVIIRSGSLLAVGFTPNSDPCGPGGTSMFMELNAFTGGSVGGSLFDITSDLKIDSKDVIKVDFDGDGTAEEIPPSGIAFDGNLQPPAILRLQDGDEKEKKYLSSSSGKIETITEKGPKLGVTYWMEVRY